MPQFLVTGLVNGNNRTEQWISAPSPNQAIKIFEDLYRSQGVRNVYFTDQK
jgi:hypothetical protein